MLQFGVPKARSESPGSSRVDAPDVSAESQAALSVIRANVAELEKSAVMRGGQQRLDCLLHMHTRSKVLSRLFDLGTLQAGLGIGAMTVRTRALLHMEQLVANDPAQDVRCCPPTPTRLQPCDGGGPQLTDVSPAAECARSTCRSTKSLLEETRLHLSETGSIGLVYARRARLLALPEHLKQRSLCDNTHARVYASIRAGMCCKLREKYARSMTYVGSQALMGIADCNETENVDQP